MHFPDCYGCWTWLMQDAGSNDMSSSLLDVLLNSVLYLKGNSIRSHWNCCWFGVSPVSPYYDPHAVLWLLALDHLWNPLHSWWTSSLSASWNQESVSAWLHPRCGKWVSKISTGPLELFCTNGLWCRKWNSTQIIIFQAVRQVDPCGHCVWNRSLYCIPS